MSTTITDLLFTALMLFIMCMVSEFVFNQSVSYMDICILSGIIYITQKI